MAAFLSPETLAQGKAMHRQISTCLRSKYAHSKLLFGAVVLLGFLPGWLILLPFLLGIGVYSAKFFIYRLSLIDDLSSKSRIIFTLFLFFPAGCILVILLFFFIVLIYPTLINFWAAFLISNYARKRWARFVIFIIASVFLGLFYRLLPLSEDIFRGKNSQKTEIIKVIELAPNEALNLHAATETVSWRADPNQLLEINGSEGTGRVYWTFPAEKKENIRTRLQEAGFRYKINGNGNKRLEVQQKNDNGLITLKLIAWEGDQKTASYEGLLRNAYGLEQALYSREVASINSPAYRLLYLASVNLSNALIGQLLPQPPASPMQTFIKQAFKTSLPVKTITKETKPVLATQLKTLARQDNLRLSFNEIEKIVNEGCTGKFDLEEKKINFLADDEEFVVFLENRAQLVKCIENTVYVFTQNKHWANPKDGKPDAAYFYLATYSLRGELLTQRTVEFQNHPQVLIHSRLDNFVATENTYQFELSEFEWIEKQDTWQKSTTIWSIPKLEPSIQ